MGKPDHVVAGLCHLPIDSTILHPNGVVTYYGHLSKIIVSQGAKVYQGQIIGYMGYSGRTIPAGPAGCHLHFDVRFAQNPFSQFSKGTQFGK